MSELLDNPFFTIVNEPFTWVILGLCLAFYVIQTLVHRETRAQTMPSSVWGYFGLEDMQPLLRALLAILWIILFVAFFAGICWTLIVIAKEVFTKTEGTSRLSLLTLAAMTAGLSGLVALPFTLIRTKNLEANTKATEQGLVTDRLNKAVEGLGAQKEVNWIGRPVTAYNGIKGTRETFFESLTQAQNEQAKNREVKIGVEEKVEQSGEGDVKQGYVAIFKVWSDEETFIEKQGEPLPWPYEDHPFKIGDWQVFKETVPNLEVRIGSIYALERIARENKDYHVQVMEILCAYIRENAPASGAVDWPELEMKDGEDDGPLEEDFEERLETFRAASDALKKTVKPRSDIQTALNVIGRRSPEQRTWEAAALGGTEGDTFPFDKDCPSYESEGPLGPEWERYEQDLTHWKTAMDTYRGYRLDLRSTNLQGADLAGLHLAAVRFEDAQMQRAYLRSASMQGAHLWGAKMQGAYLTNASMQGSDFKHAEMKGAYLRRARMQGADFLHTRMQGADLSDANLQKTKFAGAGMQKTQNARAKMQGAYLGHAKLQKAEFGNADIRWADFAHAKICGAKFSYAKLVGARLNSADLRGATLSNTHLHECDLFNARLKETVHIQTAHFNGSSVRDQNFTNFLDFETHIQGCFGDATVTLPETWTRPAHWPVFVLGPFLFDREWKKWLADPEGYIPPDPPSGAIQPK